MNRYGRKRKHVRLGANYTQLCFKPCGIQTKELQRIIIYEDEIEAIKLADLQSLYQEEASKEMQISRPTFSRLIESARKKVADAIINSKVLEISKRSNYETK